MNTAALKTLERLLKHHGCAWDRCSVCAEARLELRDGVRGALQRGAMPDTAASSAAWAAHWKAMSDSVTENNYRLLARVKELRAALSECLAELTEVGMPADDPRWAVLRGDAPKNTGVLQ